MMGKTISLAFFALLAIAASAAPITRQQALNRAQASLAKQGININVADMQAMPLKAQGTHATAAPAYYVFNSSSSFVIAAGDDRMPEVLGYSDSGTIDPNDMPDGLMALLESYAIAASDMSTIDTTLPRQAGLGGRPPIAPLLTCKWAQGAPYNLSCPLYDGTIPCVTGCVATAMAQVMHYHKWPNSISTPIPSYTSKTRGFYMPELSPEGFPGWNNILDTYGSNITDVQAEAISSLMLYCGQAINMDYGLQSSASTEKIATALINYFGYAPSAQPVYRQNYSAVDWTNLIYTELAAKRPIPFSGANVKGGHAFVCDGIDAEGRIHINWGWGGSSNGFFYPTNLTTPSQSNGGSDGYNKRQCMIIGITPGNKPIDPADSDIMYCYDLSLVKASYTRSNASQPFSDVALHCVAHNLYPETADIDFGMGLYDTSGNLMTVLYTYEFKQLPTGHGASRDWVFNFPAIVQEGTYIIRPVCCLHNSRKWKACSGTSATNWQATVTPTELTFKLLGNSEPASYRVNSATYSGRMETNRSIEMTANVTNTGCSYFRMLYLLVDGKCHSMAQCPMSPGETGDIVMHFSTPTAGNHTLMLSYDEGPASAIWQDTINIGESYSEYLAFDSYTVKNLMPGKKIYGNTFAFTCNVTNNSIDQEYDDYIRAYLYTVTNQVPEKGVARIDNSLSLQCGETKEIAFEFPDLETGKDYMVFIYIYKNGLLTNNGGLYGHTIMGSDFTPCDINADGTVDVNDLNIIIGILLNEEISFPIYIERADVDGNGTVDITDLNLTLNNLLNL